MHSQECSYRCRTTRNVQFGLFHSPDRSKETTDFLLLNDPSFFITLLPFPLGICPSLSTPYLPLLKISLLPHLSVMSIAFPLFPSNPSIPRLLFFSYQYQTLLLVWYTMSGLVGNLENLLKFCVCVLNELD